MQQNVHADSRGQTLKEKHASVEVYANTHSWSKKTKMLVMMCDRAKKPNTVLTTNSKSVQKKIKTLFII